MSWKWYRFAGLVAALLTTGLVPSCGHEQQLVSITVQPTQETVGAANIPVVNDAGAQVQLTAVGSYIHPPVNKDITNQATWTSSDTQIATVSQTGLVTATGQACGNSLISATVTTNHSIGNIPSKGAIVGGFMNEIVVCFTAIANPALTVTFSGNGAGTVTSLPAGLNCTANCTVNFPNGTSVTLTATPNAGSTFGGWMACPSANGQTCTIGNLANNVSVGVIFN